MGQVVINLGAPLLVLTATKIKAADEGIKTFVSLNKHLCV